MAQSFTELLGRILPKGNYQSNQMSVAALKHRSFLGVSNVVGAPCPLCLTVLPISFNHQIQDRFVYEEVKGTKKTHGKLKERKTGFVTRAPTKQSMYSPSNHG